MKTNKTFSLLAVLVLGLAMVGLVSAAEELDQYQTTGNTVANVGGCELAFVYWRAQTFTAGKSGELTKVVLKTRGIPLGKNDLTVELRDIGSSGEPGSTIYATVDMIVSPDSENEFIFSAPYTVTSGTQYAIVIHETTILHHTDCGSAGLYVDENNLYTDGRLWLGYWSSHPSPSGSVGWDSGPYYVNTDLYFKTYVDVTTPEPIPEFSTLAIPVATILGLLFMFSQRRRKEE